MKNGIFFDVPRDDYDLLLDRRNYSTLKLFEKSAMHYKFAVDTRPTTKADLEAHRESQRDTLLRGEATHVCALEPQLYGGADAEEEVPLNPFAVPPPAPGKFIVFSGTRDDRHKRYQAVLARAALNRQKILTPAMHETSQAIAKAIRTSPAAAPYIVGGHREVTVCWDYDEPQVGALDGWTVPMRCRLDYLTDAAIIDLKTSVSAKAEDFQRQAWNLGYFAQAAMQLDGVAAITRRVRPYLWLVVETEPPYACAVYEPDPDGIRLGREAYQQWLRQAHVCEERNEYPPYTAGPMQLGPPNWVMRRMEADL